MRKIFDMVSYGVVLSGISTIILMTGMNNGTTLFKIIIIVVTTFAIPLGLLIYSIYLVLIDRARYTRQLILFGTYHILYSSVILVLVLWMLFA